MSSDYLPQTGTVSEVVTYLDSEAFFVFKMRAKLVSVLRLPTPDWDSVRS